MQEFYNNLHEAFNDYNSKDIIDTNKDLTIILNAVREGFVNFELFDQVVHLKRLIPAINEQLYNTIEAYNQNIIKDPDDLIKKNITIQIHIVAEINEAYEKMNK